MGSDGIEVHEKRKLKEAEYFHAKMLEEQTSRDNFIHNLRITINASTGARPSERVAHPLPGWFAPRPGYAKR